MKNRKFRILCYVVAAVHLLLAALIYPSLPEQIPMNWDINGTASYNDKYELFFLCGMAFLFAVLFDVLPKIDPRRRNYQRFGTYYDGFCVVMQFFLLAATGIVLTESFRPGTISVQIVTMIGVGLLFLYIGNIMPKFKSNFYCGIKNPWTLSSETVWYKAHRLGGKCFFLAGLAVTLAALLPWPQAGFAVTLASTLAAALIPTVMSYVWWKQENPKTQS